MSHLLVMVLGLPAVPFQGYVYATTWAWFAVPLGVPEISIWHALGLALMIFMVSDETSDIEDVNWINWAVAAYVKPLVILGVSAIYHGLMS